VLNHPSQLRERREIPINYLTRFGLRRTRQSEPIPHADQVPNSAGGFEPPAEFGTWSA